MNCLICKSDISDPAQQFGDVKHPICQSDYLAGFGWVYENEDIVKWLESGISLQEACELAVKDEITDLQKFAENLWTETSSTATESQDGFTLEKLQEAIDLITRRCTMVWIRTLS